jgi:hypothetical protein
MPPTRDAFRLEEWDGNTHPDVHGLHTIGGRRLGWLEVPWSDEGVRIAAGDFIVRDARGFVVDGRYAEDRGCGDL